MYRTYIIRRNIVLDKRFYTSRFVIFMKFLLFCYSSYIQDHTITILVYENNTLFTRILNIPESHFLLKIIYYFEETFSNSHRLTKYPKFIIIFRWYKSLPKIHFFAYILKNLYKNPQSSYHSLIVDRIPSHYSELHYSFVHSVSRATGLVISRFID